MAKKIIKVRLFTWFQDGESPVDPSQQVRTERLAHFGDDVEIDDDKSLKRGEDLDAFFSDEEAQAIREGSYTGRHAALLAQFRSGVRPASQIQPADDEGPQVDHLDADQIAEYINENKLNVDATVRLAHEGDADSINKIYDAEIAAAQKRGDDPRKGVTGRLDAMLTAATSGD